MVFPTIHIGILNILVPKSLNLTKASTSSVYMLSSINFWHARLCHINSRYVQIMSSLGLIPNLSKVFEKCETCC